MTQSFSDKPREEDYDQSYDAREGRYKGYREPVFPEGYAAYGQNGSAEAVYDTYEYDHSESTSQGPNRSFCKQLRSCWSDMGKAKHIRRRFILRTKLNSSMYD